MSLELQYFDGPGRAELVRLALHAGGVEFKDTRLEGKDFGPMKGNLETPCGSRFGSLPVLINKDGYVLAQSVALSIYASELALGSGDLTAEQRAVDNMLVCTHADVQQAMYKGMFGSDESKAAGMEALPAAAKKFLAGVSRIYKESGFVHGGDKPSLGDLAVFDFVTSKFPGLLALKQDISAFPKIEAVVAKVKACPALKEYLAARGF